MTVPATTRRVGPFLGNGSATSFPFYFQCFTVDDFALTITAPDGIDSALTRGVDYNVTLNPDQDDDPGGTITYPISGSPMAAGYTLSGVGALAYDQTSSFPAGGSYRAQTHERAFDRTVFQIQQLAEELGRALRLPASATGGVSTELPAPQAQHVIGWDEAASALVNYSPTDLATVVIAGTSFFAAFDGDDVETVFVLPADPGSVNALDVFIGGVAQRNGIDFTVSGSTLTFTTPPVTGTQNIGVRFTQAMPQGETSGDQLQEDLANTSDLSRGDALVGVKQPVTGSVARTQHYKNAEVISLLDLGVTEDEAADQRLNVIDAFEKAVAAGVTVFAPARTYLCSDWIPLPSGLKLFCEPGAVFRLTADTGPIGGFFIGGYDIDLTPRAFADVDIHNLHLDCNSIPGENGFSAAAGNNVRLYNPIIRNTVYGDLSASARLGGRAFQFEGGLILGVNVFNPTIIDCSIGINSQGDANAGAARPAGVSYFNVTMRNVDVPFNVDGQYLNPENVNPENFSTNVEGYTLWNCGRAQWPGASSPLVGAIVAGDRGSGLRLRGGRLINEVAYGAINSILRGYIYGIDIELDYDVPSMACVFDFNMTGFGAPSASATFAWAVGRTRGKGNLDYIVKGSGNGIGAARLDCTVAGAAASLTGLIDSLAASQSPSALFKFTNSDDGVTTGLMPAIDISRQGNAFSVWRRQPATGFVEVQHTKSATDENFVQLFSVNIPNDGRLSIQYLVTVNYPGSVDSAVLALSGLVVGIKDSGGAFTTAVGSNIQSALALDGVVSQTATVSMTTGGAFQVLLDNEPADATTLVTVWARVVLVVGATPQQPAITYL